MTRKEIIDGLKFTVEMFLFDPSTGETFTEPRNDMDKTTIDACRGAIELLEQTDGDLISRTDLLNKIWQKEYGKDYDGVNMLNIPHIDIIENMPSADNTAEWISKDITDLVYCSKCDYREWYIYATDYNYCPNCGRRMKGVD